MPGFDGTGPRGMGPMTGGRRGWCNPGAAMYGGQYGYAPAWGYPQQPYGGYGYGRMPFAGGFGRPGMGMPFGMGYGRPWGFGRGMGPCGGGMGWGRGRGMGRGWGW
ncbi:MAG: DUF5320 domain-containing protein [candidate division WS1 bacterium]|jgi:hypothetical protein|nr:DUF5320 domain-containing protein [candidate division WS1 bacterium]